MSERDLRFNKINDLLSEILDKDNQTDLTLGIDEDLDLIISQLNKIKERNHELAIVNHKLLSQNAVLINNITNLEYQDHKNKIIFDNLSDGVFTSDGIKFTSVNKPLCKIFGYSEDEFLQMNIWDIAPVENRAEAKEKCLKLINDNSSFPIEIESNKKNGKSFVAEIMLHYSVSKEFISGSLKNISLQKKLERMLINAKKKAEESDRMKSIFLANMSHEIRTPLNGIIGMSNLLSRHNLKPPCDEYLNSIHNSSSFLYSIINNVLDISKIEAGKMEINLESFNLRDLINELILLNKNNEEKNLHFQFSISSDIPVFIKTDKTKFSQILFNLLSNAVKFTLSGKIILELSIQSRTSSHITLNVKITDTGIGISKDNLSIIFNSFTQADSSITKKFGGTGLGLYITKKMVEILGGEINVKSEIGNGSAFEFFINVEEGIETSPEIDFTSTSQELNSSRIFRILVAEDNLINQKYIKAFLEIQHFKCTIVNNGYEAIEELKKNNYDCILMDNFMPQMDGVTATKYIRKMEGLNTKIPIIAVTAGAIAEERERCLEAGMNDFITKPIDELKLKNAMARVFKFHNQNQNTKTSEDAQLIQIEDTIIEYHVLDIKDLKEKVVLVGSDILILMIEHFMSSYNEEVLSIEESIATQNIEEIRFKTHAFKNTIINFSVLDIYHLFNNIKVACDKQDISEVRNLFNEVKQVLPIIERELILFRNEIAPK